jgi:putative ABC transport system substrate-binding protein
MKPTTNWRAIAVILTMLVVLLVLYYLATPSGRSRAMQPESAEEYRVALFSYISHPVLDEVRLSIEQRLRELTQAAGASIEFHRYNAEGSDSQIAALTGTILAQELDLIIPISTPVSRQIVQSAPSDTRIVYSFVTNPENLGPERFTRNVTGVSDAVNYPGNVALILDWIPEVRRIGMLFNPSEPNSVDALNQARPLFEQRGIEVLVAEVSSATEVPMAALNLAPDVDAFYVGGDNTVVGAMPSLVEIAYRQKKPVFASDSGSVDYGAVAAISVRYAEIGEVTADLAWKVLSEERPPREIPPVAVSGRELIYNPAALEELNIQIPAEYSHRARPNSD